MFVTVTAFIPKEVTCNAFFSGKIGQLYLKWTCKVEITAKTPFNSIPHLYINKNKEKEVRCNNNIDNDQQLD